MARNVLNLATLIDRATVTIDGTPHELINPEELSIVDTHRVSKWGARVQELNKDIDIRGEQELQEMRSLLDQLCRLLLRAPAEVHDKLNDNQRLLVAMAFTALQRGTLPAPEGAKEEPAAAESVVDPSETSTGGNS